VSRIERPLTPSEIASIVEVEDLYGNEVGARVRAEQKQRAEEWDEQKGRYPTMQPARALSANANQEMRDAVHQRACYPSMFPKKGA
jgi:hypothetical protein